MHLFGPPVRAVLIGADVVQPHFLFGATCLSLEEDGFAMTALGARMVLGSRQCRVGNDVGHDVRQLAGRFRVICDRFVMENKWNLLDFVHNFVHVNAVTVGLGLIVAVSARIQQDFVLLVLLWVEHVVAFLQVI